MGPVSVDVIKRELCRDIDRLVQALYPNAELDGNEYRLGGVDGSKGRSMAIHRGSRRPGVWKDWAADTGGDVIDLIAAAQCAGDVGAAIGWARNYLGIGGMTPEQRRKAEEDATRDRKAREREEEQNLAKLRKAALARFLEAVPLLGTPAETYLLSRAIELRSLGRQPGALRYHPALKCPEHGVLRPAFIGKVDGPDGELLSIHRTFLAVQADGRVTKATADPDRPMKDCKRAYCEYGGGWIPVWRGASGRPMRHAPEGEWIVITEGMEDALSVASELPQMRVIAALSLSNLGKLKLPERIGGVYIHRQNDTNPETIRAYERAAAQLARRHEVREVRAPAPFKDFTEWREKKREAMWRARDPLQQGAA